MENTAPYTPEQNGKSERDNRTVIESARTMLQAKKLPTYLWAEATNTAVYTLNRTGHSRMGGSKTPYELWTNKKPDLSHMKVFGSDAYAHVPKQLTKKFDPRAKKLILVGYEGESANYRLYDTETKNVSISRHVIFREQANGDELSEPVMSEVDWEPADSERKEGKLFFCSLCTEAPSASRPFGVS